MKKFLIAAAFAAGMATSAFAAHSSMEGLALGVEWRGDYVFGGNSFANGAAFTFKLPGIPPVFGLSFYIGNAFSMGLTADWWLWKPTLASGAIDVCLYVGPGLYGQVLLGSTFNLDLGLRIPVGLQLWVLQPLELFIEIAPAIGVGGIGGTISFPRVTLQSAVGLRFWF